MRLWSVTKLWEAPHVWRLGRWNNGCCVERRSPPTAFDASRRVPSTLHADRSPAPIPAPHRRSYIGREVPMSAVRRLIVALGFVTASLVVWAKDSLMASAYAPVVTDLL